MLSAFALTNCTQEIENPAQQPEETGYPFEIVASTVDTKTVNDGMHTKWAEGDQINLFHAVTDGTDYKNNGAFTVKDVEAGSFTGNLSETLDVEEEYDWYALYPYSDKITTPGERTAGFVYIGYSSGLNQTEYNSTASLKGSVCPLYGVAKAVPGADMPSIEMKHLSSVVAIKITNKTNEPLTVTEASITAEEDIVGTYYIDITGESVNYTPSAANYVKNTAVVKITGEVDALSTDESATLYAAIKPFTAEAGQKLTLSVNGYSKELTLPKDVTFSAGKIKTVNFSYDKVQTAGEGIAIPWFEDFSSKDLSKYTLTNGGTTTALYTEDPLAGGQAPEILISKDGGSLTATLSPNGYVGDLTLTFKSNHPDYLTVTTTSGVTVKKVLDNEYTLSVPSGISSFSITLKNSKSSNTRVDDIEVAKPRLTQTLTFAEDLYEFELGSVELTGFKGQTVSGNQTTVTYSSNNTNVANVDASTGVVTMTGESGTAVITAAAAQTSEYKSAIATYSIVVSDPSATVVEKTITYNFGKDTEVGFSKWDSSYKKRVANYTDATVTFQSANKQGSTITDCPVTKGQDVMIVMGDNRSLKSFNLTLKKWSSKAQTVTLHYSKDGGATYTKTSTTSSTFALSADVPEGTNAIKFTFSSASNQVGIVSCELTFDVAE